MRDALSSSIESSLCDALSSSIQVFNQMSNHVSLTYPFTVFVTVALAAFSEDVEHSLACLAKVHLATMIGDKGNPWCVSCILTHNLFCITRLPIFSYAYSDASFVHFEPSKSNVSHLNIWHIFLIDVAEQVGEEGVASSRALLSTISVPGTNGKMRPYDAQEKRKAVRVVGCTNHGRASAS